MRIHLALFEGTYVWLIPCEKEVFLSQTFYKKRTRFLLFFGHVIGTLLELQKKSNEETQYIVVKNSVHHKIL